MHPFILALLMLMNVAPMQSQNMPDLECQTCHSPDTWIPLSPNRPFTHEQTHFPLEGVHQTVPCEDCHTGSTTEERHEFAGASTECASCHLDVHKNQLGQDCQRCHSPKSWTILDKRKLHDNTMFPLTGIHLAVDCVECHGTPQGQDYAGTPMRCVDCHREAFNNTTSPSHSAFNFGTLCDDCHTTFGWQPASADHSKFGYFLEGIHAHMSCIDCHLTYNFTSQSCIKCHQDDYVRGHVEKNYIVQESCEDCHTTGEWKFTDHDKLYFPIYSGSHKGKWSTCTAECHITNQDFSQFTCGLNGICHEHDKDRMDRRHQGEVRNYQYDSDACYQCHSNGRGDD